MHAEKYQRTGLQVAETDPLSLGDLGNCDRSQHMSRD